MPEFPSPKIPAGTVLAGGRKEVLFEPFSVRDVSFQNRIWVSPMCQYSATDGHINDYHFAHLASFFLRGASLTIAEATAVSSAGRISPFDCGLWTDSQIKPLARLVSFAHAQGQKFGIQLAHAGRKASTKAPWQLQRGRHSEIAPASEGGWPDRVVGPTAEVWGEGHAQPSAMSVEEIDRVVEEFAAAARRAVRAAVDVIEIHAAHGYLLSSFLSPSSNTRTDLYGGSFENRCRLSLRIIKAMRAVMPHGMPLLFRVSSTEWLQDGEQWDAAETARLATALDDCGVDVLVMSSGGNNSRQRIPRTADYQTSIAGEVRREVRQKGCKILIGLVGRITQPEQAVTLLGGRDREPDGDVVLIGRQFLKEPSWVLRAAHELNVRVQWPLQYQLGRYGLETKL